MVVFIATTAGIIILTAVGGIVGGIIAKTVKGPIKVWMTMVTHVWYIKKAKRKIKKGILTRDKQLIRNGFDLLSDNEYNNIKERLFKLYNLTDEIIFDDVKFRTFYNIVEPSIDSYQVVMDYCNKHELTVIENSVLGGDDRLGL